MTSASVEIMTLGLVMAALCTGMTLGWILYGTLRGAQLKQALSKAELIADQISDQLEKEQAARRTLELKTEEIQLQKTTLQTEMAHMKGQRTAETANIDQRLKDMADIRASLDKEIKSVADAALKSNQNHFLNLAQQLFQQERDIQKTELKPVQDTLKQYQNRLTQFEKDSQAGLHRVSQEIRHVADLHQRVERQTAKLTNALRAAPKTRGRWGEHQLRNVLELAGMAEHADFNTEVNLQDDTGKTKRPDVIIHMPNNMHLIVDAKVSMSAYLDAVDATDEQTREDLLGKHAQEMKNHVKDLGSKAYWRALPKNIGEGTDMVAMFIPGDNFYAAAVERDPELFSYALTNRVLIVTPTTLFAVAKAIAYGWQQAAISDNARHIAELGQKLYNQMTTSGAHIQSIGKAITASVDSYNRFVGSMEARTMPAARKFTELKGIQTSAPLPELTPIDETARTLTRNKDLLFDDNNN